MHDLKGEQIARLSMVLFSVMFWTGCAFVSGRPPQAILEQASQVGQSRQSSFKPVLENATDGVSDPFGSDISASAAEPLQSFRRQNLQETAAEALGRIGTAAVPELKKTLSEDDPKMRKMAAEILSRIGPEAKEAVPELTAALSDEDAEVRKAAARALGQIGPGALDATPELINALRE